MSAKIIVLNLKNRPTRKQAIQWLSQNFKSFPKIQNGLMSDAIFHNWKFIKATDGVVYFADCIHPGITQGDLSEFVSVVDDYNQEVISK